jgi:hypothetical protein
LKLTVFETIYHLVNSLDHDIRTPLAVLENDLNGLLNKKLADTAPVARMKRQLLKLEILLPPMTLIKEEIESGKVQEDLKQGTQFTWFCTEVFSYVTKRGCVVESFFINDATLVLKIVGIGCGGSAFDTFAQWHMATADTLPKAVVIFDAIIEFMEYKLEIKFV